MTEIYSIDIAAHDRFAQDQEVFEAFKLQYHLPLSRAGLIAVQTKVLDFIPKHSAIVVLLQIYQRKTWARFSIPKNYHNQRFLSSYVAPSLGPAEKQDADIQRIESYLQQKRKTGQENQREKEEEETMEDEGQTIIQLLSKGVKETNQMVDFVIARMHQFVQA
jgi:hypothetical protein